MPADTFPTRAVRHHFRHHSARFLGQHFAQDRPNSPPRPVLRERSASQGRERAGRGRAEAPKLERLRLADCKVTDAGLNFLPRLIELRSRTFDDTKLTDAALAHLPALPHLKELDLIWSRKMTDQGIAYVAKCPVLETLSFRWMPKLTDASIKHLAHSKSIKNLDIAGTKVTDAAVKHLQKMSSLRKIDIWKTQITPAGVDQLKKALPKCKVKTTRPR